MSIKHPQNAAAAL